MTIIRPILLAVACLHLAGCLYVSVSNLVEGRVVGHECIGGTIWTEAVDAKTGATWRLRGIRGLVGDTIKWQRNGSTP